MNLKQHEEQVSWDTENDVTLRIAIAQLSAL